MIRFDSWSHNCYPLMELATLSVIRSFAFWRFRVDISMFVLPINNPVACGIAL